MNNTIIILIFIILVLIGTIIFLLIRKSHDKNKCDKSDKDWETYGKISLIADVIGIILSVFTAIFFIIILVRMGKKS